MPRMRACVRVFSKSTALPFLSEAGRQARLAMPIFNININTNINIDVEKPDKQPFSHSYAGVLPPPSEKHSPHKSPNPMTSFSHRAKTFTTPSPPPLTTHLPSRLHTTAHTPSPRISRWLVSSWLHERFSSDQKRRLASWPAETSSRPSGERERAAMAEGCASMV